MKRDFYCQGRQGRQVNFTASQPTFSFFLASPFLAAHSGRCEAAHPPRWRTEPPPKPPHFVDFRGLRPTVATIIATVRLSEPWLLEGSKLVEVRTVYDRQPANNRSAIGNRSRLFVDAVDGRSAIARRYRDLVAEHSSDLGGAEVLSEAQRQMIRRAASLACWCENIECKLAEGEDIDIGPYTTATNALRRVLVDLGLERRSKDVTLHERLAAYQTRANASAPIAATEGGS